MKSHSTDQTARTESSIKANSAQLENSRDRPLRDWNVFRGFQGWKLLTLSEETLDIPKVFLLPRSHVLVCEEKFNFLLECWTQS